MMKLTEKILSVVLGFCMIFVLSPSVKASGIPTADIATLNQLLQNALAAAQQAKDQLDKIQEQIDYYKKLYEGNWELQESNRGGNGTATTIEDDIGLPTEWKKVYENGQSEVEDLREEYGLKVPNEARQKEFDNLLYQMQFFKKTYADNIDRANRFRQLATLLNTAETPLQKESLMNKIAYEQLQLQADQAAITNMNSLMQQEKELADKQREHEFNKMMLGKKYQHGE